MKFFTNLISIAPRRQMLHPRYHSCAPDNLIKYMMPVIEHNVRKFNERLMDDFLVVLQEALRADRDDE